jgi:phosphoadenosine phosphosulfate reductase
VNDTTVALDYAELARGLDDAPPSEIISWAVERFRPSIVLACSFGGPTGMVALDMVMNVDRTIPVYYLDTGLLFRETYELVERVRRQYGIDPIPVAPDRTVAQQAEAFGPALWERDPNACCAMRKVQPQLSFLQNFDAWISGIRRDQAKTREATQVVQYDARFKVAKICPLAHWDERMVWTYIDAHHLPYNALHDAGYPSVGCVPCTRAVADGEDRRAGRWPGFNKIECGLHAEPAAGEH